MKRTTDGIIFGIILMVLWGYGLVSAEVLDRIVAIVNTDIITQVQLEKQAAPYVSRIEAEGHPEEKKKQMIEALKHKILDAMIEAALAQQEARKYQISVSDEEIDRAIADIKRSRNMTDADFEQALKKEGLTLAEYKEDFKNQILRVRLINHTVKSKVVINKADVQQRYEDTKERYAGVRKHHIRNILMDTEAKINRIKELLDENADFENLAQTYSMAPNADEGGDLGLFDISGFPEKIRDALFVLKKGEYTDVINTAQGFQIFYVEDIVMDGAKTMEEAYDEIHGILYKEQVEKKFKTWIESLKEKAHIQKMI